MRHIPVSEARAELSALVNEVAYKLEQVVLTRHGKPVAAIVPIQDMPAARAVSSLTGAGAPDEHELRDDLQQAAHLVRPGEQV
jgi:prevent-host-death family protein